VKPRLEGYYGVEIAGDGALFVAERRNGDLASQTRYPAGAAGASALRDRIAREADHPHICIRSCNGASLSLASELMTLPGSQVTLVNTRAIAPAPASAEDRASRLARLAERLF
jgi:hypothetical protein